ncbi:hypothetical protein [Legionella erythra]|nr:hypothetical protein [Legionella erythra]
MIRWILLSIIVSLNRDIYIMGILKTILKKIAKIIHFRPYSEWTENEKAKYAKQNSFRSCSKSNNTEINPATGLPMIGALDSMGNSFGSSASDRDNYWNNDYHRYSTYNSSSYDPFNNRY